jgi:hypothetical protein
MRKPLKPEANLATRVNISMTPDLIRLANKLRQERGESKFSRFIANLIREERDRRQPKPQIQSFTATLPPFDDRVAEVVKTLTEDFKGYMARCMRDSPDTGGKSAMFGSWALQRLASLVVRGLELDERITGLEGSRR